MTTMKTVKSIDRAIHVLNILAREDKPLGVSDLSRKVSIPKASVFRILYTLEHHGLLMKDPSSQLYTFGPLLLQLSEKVAIFPWLDKIAYEPLRELAQRTQETANLGVLSNGKVIVIQTLSGRKDSKFSLQLGPIAELHSSSLGKAILLDKTNEEILKILGDEPFESFTKNTKTSFRELCKDLEQIRQSGISMDLEETEEGLICVGSPIYDWNNKVIASVSVSALKSRLLPNKLEMVKSLVLSTATFITKQVQQSTKEPQQV